MFSRYCFRKVRLNDEEPVGLRHDLPSAIQYLREHSEVREVILSGGDPLVLSDRRLDEVLTAVRSVPSVRALRIHTRTPATLPARVTPELAAMLARHRPLTVVTHYNHPKELTNQAERAIEALLRQGIPVLNQSVLLRGVNDSDETLLALLRGLSERMVRPYYLHHPDLTVGTQHLRVSLDRGLALARALRGRLPGHAIPTYVLDIPGGLGKVPVDSGFVTPLGEPGLWQVRSPFGPVVTYRDLAAGAGA
jgi:lysine 2,3-aminomutase